MREYRTPIYDENGNPIGTLVFTAQDLWEADRVVDQYTFQHPGQYPNTLELKSKPVETPQVGEVRLS